MDKNINEKRRMLAKALSIKIEYGTQMRNCLKLFSDADLSDILLAETWANEELHTFRSELIEEVIERLRKPNEVIGR